MRRAFARRRTTRGLRWTWAACSHRRATTSALLPSIAWAPALSPPSSRLSPLRPPLRAPRTHCTCWRPPVARCEWAGMRPSTRAASAWTATCCTWTAPRSRLRLAPRRRCWWKTTSTRSPVWNRPRRTPSLWPPSTCSRSVSATATSAPTPPFPRCAPRRPVRPPTWPPAASLVVPSRSTGTHLPTRAACPSRATWSTCDHSA
mmetsp:Transcript_10304/g.32654  ORF Transcript_10304/g.32654 Transcript_10304/m.32654 type:complete len:203 (+) Transcript_10304:2326-2934(+)